MSRRLPTLDQYNDTVQHPRTAFTDPALQQGAVRLNGLGLPEPTTGGFAITYELTAAGKRYAVRLFHKDSPDLEGRYRAISSTLEKLRSDYFVEFKFQPTGIKVGSDSFPLVKMDWIKGETLGSFLEKNYANTSTVDSIRKDLQGAGSFLAANGIAHGDFQTGNILVVGSKIRLIDYDGMFVPSIASKQSSELGHRHFQHPLRDAKHFDATLDRFSLILIDLSLEAILEQPKLYSKFATTGENILFTRNDLIDPGGSAILRELRAIPRLKAKAERFSALCLTPFEHIPSFADFNSGAWVPSVIVPPPKPAAQVFVSYQGAFDVVDASDYEAVRRKVGDKVEMIGCVVEVKGDVTRGGRLRGGKTYIFVNFGNWRGKMAKITLWHDGIGQLTKVPDSSWTGKWVSVTGLVDAPYTSHRYHYTHVGITVSGPGQMHLIAEDEAQYRLGRKKRQSNGGQASDTTASNRDILREIGSGVRPSSPGRASQAGSVPRVLPQPKPLSQNERILQQISRSSGGSTPAPTGSTNKPTSAKPQEKSQCFVATACFNDAGHVDVETFRLFRDQILTHHHSGRWFIAFYYQYGQGWARWLDRNTVWKPPIRFGLGCLALALRKLALR